MKSLRLLLPLALALLFIGIGCGDSEDLLETTDQTQQLDAQKGDKSDRIDARRPGYSPCGENSCGETCTICHPRDRDCYETAVVKFCQADGSCHPRMPLCEGINPPEEPVKPDPVYEPCAESSCGETCTICPPNDPDCIETAVVKFCHPNGSCSPLEPICEGINPPGGPIAIDLDYDPCGGKVCGEQCTHCAPWDRDCYETAVMKYCSDDGQCKAGTATCRM